MKPFYEHLSDTDGYWLLSNCPSSGAWSLEYQSLVETVADEHNKERGWTSYSSRMNEDTPWYNDTMEEYFSGREVKFLLRDFEKAREFYVDILTKRALDAVKHAVEQATAKPDSFIYDWDLPITLHRSLVDAGRLSEE